MTAYLVWFEVDGKLEPLGDVEANSPEHAVRRMVARIVENEGEPNGVYFSAPQGSTARIEVSVEPSIKVNLTSDRVVRPRAPRKPAKSPRGRK